tara:strand:- start:21284 stop:21898 length:615 start_codon:yes stop_codon:yes gene_type:complete
MNFLAHFHVSPPSADAIAGAFLGDFIRGSVSDHVDLPLEMRNGITLHRRVDAFTDSHSIWQRSAERLAPERRRLAGIIIDVIYDHYLCRNWDDFSQDSLPDFVGRCYTSLLSRTQFMEVEPRRVVRRMQEHDWLNSYLDPNGIALAFRRLSLRSKALVGIERAAEDFEANYDLFQSDFLEYYPKLQNFAEREWKALTAPIDADS